MADPEVKDASEAKKGLNPIILILVAVVLLAVAGGGFFFFVASGNKAQDTEAQEEVKKKKEEKPKVFYQFEDSFIVNLAETNAERYLKVTPVFEVESEDVQNEITEKLPQIKDILITIFSSKTLDEVTTLSGKDRLKQEIIDKVNEVLAKGKVTRVFFSDFVIQ